MEATNVKPAGGKVRHPVYFSPNTSRRLKRLKADSDQPISNLVEEIVTGRRPPLVNSNPSPRRKAK